MYISKQIGKYKICSLTAMLFLAIWMLSAPVSARQAMAGRQGLTTEERLLYDGLIPQIRKVAVGEETCTVLSLDFSDATKREDLLFFTAESLGVEKLYEAGQGPSAQEIMDITEPESMTEDREDNTEDVYQLTEEAEDTTEVEYQLTEEADDAITGQLNHMTERLLTALLADCPKDLFWFDGSQGLLPSYELCLVEIGEEVGICVSQVSFTFPILEDYAEQNSAAEDSEQSTVEGESSCRTIIDQDRLTSAISVLFIAENIVRNAASRSDMDKLKTYRDRILYLANYLEDAEAVSGPPMQILSVFDADFSTRVTCEAYARAFQYLCDLTIFDGNITCMTVYGTVTYGDSKNLPHAYNLLDIDGQHYIVDLTNCDEGTIGAPNLLYLCGASGSPRDGLQVNLSDETEDAVIYQYNEDQIDLFGEARLTPAGWHYGTPEIHWEEDEDGIYTIATVSYDGAYYDSREIEIGEETSCLEGCYYQTTLTASAYGISDSRTESFYQHEPGEPVMEDYVQATAESPESYRLVTYCEKCGEILSEEIYPEDEDSEDDESEDGDSEGDESEDGDGEGDESEGGDVESESGQESPSESIAGEESDVSTESVSDKKSVSATSTVSSPHARVIAGTFPVKIKQRVTICPLTGLSGADRVISYRSSRPALVKVALSGRNACKLIAGKKKGTAVITATLRSGRKLTFRVKVQRSKVKTSKLTVEKSIALRRGQKRTLKVSVWPLTSREKVVYSTSKRSVITVSKRGVLRARKAGRAVIRVRSGSKTVKVKVRVKG